MEQNFLIIVIILQKHLLNSCLRQKAIHNCTMWYDVDTNSSSFYPNKCNQTYKCNQIRNAMLQMFLFFFLTSENRINIQQQDKKQNALNIKLLKISIIIVVFITIFYSCNKVYVKQKNDLYYKIYFVQTIYFIL